MSRKRILLLVLVFSLVLGAIPAYASNKVDPPSKHMNYSGEMIYRGLVFGQGPVAKYFPNIWPHEIQKKTNSKKYKLEVNKILQRMKEKDPSYFIELQRAVYSGDYLKTEDVLTNGGKLLFSVLKDMEVTIRKENSGRVEPNVVAYLPAVISVLGAYSHALVLTGAVVGVEIVYLYGAFYGPGINNNGSNLQKEMAVKQLVKQMSIN